MITRTHTPTQNSPFFLPIMPKNRAQHLFLKITFFFALYSFSLTPKHFLISSRNEKTFFFFFFFIIYFTFSLSPYGKTQNHLLFPPFLSPEIGKPYGKTSHAKFFFFFFLIFCIPPLLVIGKITTHLFFEIPT